MLNTVKTYHAKKQGKHLLVMGAIHGDEVCGPKAINRLIQQLEDGNISLEAGNLTLIPVCNERAYAQNVRYVDENLNRIFVPHGLTNSYEAMLVKEIMPHVDACDVLLDIHSFHTPGTPFVFQDSPEVAAFAHAVQFPIIMTGWPEIYAPVKDKNEGDTVGYALQQGKDAILIECGQHEDPQGVELAYQAILNALFYTGLVTRSAQTHAGQTQVIHMQKAFFKEKDGSLTKSWMHGDKLIKGEVIANYEDGSVLTAPDDGFILLPNAATKTGDEWFYFGVSSV